MPRSYKRRQYLINRSFQLKFVGTILLFMILGSLLSAVTIYYNTWMLLGDKLSNVYPQGRLMEIVRQANTTLLVRISLFIPLVAILGIVLSHRIAGPIYHIKKVLDDVAGGDYKVRLQLRKTDELQDVAESINKVISLIDRDKSCEG